MPRRWNLLLLPPETLPLELEARHLRGELAGLLLFGHEADSPELAAVLKRIPHLRLNSHRGSGADQTRVSGFRFELFAAEASCETIELSIPQEVRGFESLSDAEFERTLEQALPAIQSGEIDGLFSPEERMTALLCRVFVRRGIAVRPRLVSCNHTPEFFAGIYPRPASIDLGPRMLAELALNELMRRISGEEPRADHIAVIVTPQLVPGE